MFKRVCILVGGLLILGIYFLVNPGHSEFIPRCPFHWLTGWDCPACGSQRALHQLLHLNIKAAIAYNPFLVISIPYLIALVWVQWFDPHHRFTRLRTICHHRFVINTYLVLIIAWWIFRNVI